MFEHPAKAQIPKLGKIIASMQTVNVSFMQELTQEGTSGGGPVSKTKLHLDQEDAEPDQLEARVFETCSLAKQVDLFCAV